MARKGETTSAETKAKMAAAHKARWANRRSIYLQTCNYIHIGSKRSLTTRIKMSLAHRGISPSEETRKRISESVKAVLLKKALDD